MPQVRQQPGRDVWRRPALTEALRDALAKLGPGRPALTVDDLAHLDQIHNGGIAATRALARLLDPRPGARVLDVGGGLGGPARLLAAEFGCDVTVLDVSHDYVQAGAFLTTHLGLQGSVRFVLGSALALPYPAARFDVIWTQNSGMNIEDKAALYAEFFRVLRPGGRLATQEPVAGPVQPLHFPVVWAHDAASSFLLSAPALRTRIASAGFRELIWEARPPAPTLQSTGPAPVVTIQHLLMGDRLPAIQAAALRNDEEGRIARIQAVFERIEASLPGHL
jgi:sarcosine/dimethylglycine N-methyltransferase